MAAASRTTAVTRMTRRTAGPAPRLDLIERSPMTFEAPDENRFPAIPIARAAGASGPGATRRDARP